MSNNHLLPTDTLNSAAKSAVCYCRTCCDSPDSEKAITEQLDAISKYAEQNGYCIIGEYIDIGKSGTSMSERENLCQMLNDSQKGEFQYVIVHECSRIARNHTVFQKVETHLAENNVEVLPVLFPTDTPPNSEFSRLLEAQLQCRLHENQKARKRGYKG